MNSGQALTANGPVAITRQALTRGELLLVYQPLVDVRTHQAAGAEALVRWRHPVEGVLRPARFIPQSEDSGLIVEIGRWVLGEACRERARWRAAAVRTGPIAVNVSAHELAHPGYLASVLEALDSADLEARLLELEVTESALVASFDRVRDTVQSLREEGIGIALDDFGIGYDFLRSLRNIGVDRLKIPIELIGGVGKHSGCNAIIDAVLALGNRLGLTLVAEGVETAEQLELLRARGCDLAQGNFLCPPAAPRDAQRWIESRLAAVRGPSARSSRPAGPVGLADGQSASSWSTITTSRDTIIRV